VGDVEVVVPTWVEAKNVFSACVKSVVDFFGLNGTFDGITFS
jgi:hypothetical protein